MMINDVLDTNLCMVQYEVARSQLIIAQEHGLDRYIWSVYVDPTLDFPRHDQTSLQRLFGIKKEYMGSSELVDDYVKRIIGSGRRHEFPDRLLVARGKVCLDFNFQHTGDSENEEKVVFYDIQKGFFGPFLGDLGNIEGVVNVRRHHYGLAYRGWDLAEKLPTSIGAHVHEPHEIHCVHGGKP